MLLQTLSVANMLLHANRWREVQKDMGLLMCELGNCHLRTGETSVGLTARKHCFIFRFHLKTISGRNKINRVSENWERILKIVNLNWITRICKEPHGPGTSFKSKYYTCRIPKTPTVGASSLWVKLKISSVIFVQYICCILVKFTNREHRNIVFEEHRQNRVYV